MAERAVGPGPVGVGEATLIALAEMVDARGSLAVGQVPDGLPFTPMRFFVVRGAVGGATRGGHAHRVCQQLLVAVAGRVELTLSDGTDDAVVELDTPVLALHLPAGIWSQQRLDERAALLVLASHPYDPDGYLPDMDLPVRQGDKPSA